MCFDLYEKFRNPPPEFRGKPFWSWNGELEKDELIRQISIIKQMGWSGYFMHSRAGLQTEYLGEKWFQMINSVADSGEVLGMQSWLYDEDRWPSGSAGGMVTADKKYRMKSLLLSEYPADRYQKNRNNIISFIAKIDGINLYRYRQISSNESFSDLEFYTSDKKDGKGVWKILTFSVITAERASNYNGNTYTDTMNLAATERFIELTHEKYKTMCGKRLGNEIKGIFTDEPHRGSGMGDLKEKDGIRTCTVAWTDDIFAEFISRYHYDALAVLPELFYRPDGEKIVPVKHDYFELANDLFLERFTAPISRWCKENNLLLTGHVLHEDSLTSQAAPHGSLMRFYTYMDIPGVDVLTAGNRCYWIVKQLSSTARQSGKKRMLSEMYGCTGWEFDFEGHIASGNWQALLGINFRCPHLSWYTMEGEAKRDCPGSIFHQATFYPYYHYVEDYFSRFAVFMSGGKEQCDVLVVNPVESAWSQCYLGWADWIFTNSDDVKSLENQYEKLFMTLMNSQIDFDYGDERMIKDSAEIIEDNTGKPYIKLGCCKYAVVIIGGMITIRSSTLRLLEKFRSLGGTVIFVGDIPAYTDAEKSNRPRNLSNNSLTVPFEDDQIEQAVKAHSSQKISINKKQNVFSQVRIFDDGIGIATINTGSKRLDNVVLEYTAQEQYLCEEWDAKTGNRYALTASFKDSGTTKRIHTALEPSQARFFFLCKNTNGCLPEITLPAKLIKEYFLSAAMPYSLSEKNACVLDFARWRIPGNKWNEYKEVLKVDREIRRYFSLECRGGEMLQPWFIKKYGTVNFGTVELEYTFEVETLPSDDLYLEVEHPEKFGYELNGTKLLESGGFWIDNCFKRLIIPAAIIKTGKNTIYASTDFNALSNIEALYLIGDFGVKTAEKNCVLTNTPAKIAFGNLSEFMLPFYTGVITYHIYPEQYPKVGELPEKCCIFINIESFYGSLLKIASGEKEILLYSPPYEINVTQAVLSRQTIDITLVCTRRNLFGPLHHSPALMDAYDSSAFISDNNEWTDEYSLVKSGIFKCCFKVYLD